MKTVEEKIVEMNDLIKERSQHEAAIEQLNGSIEDLFLSPTKKSAPTVSNGKVEVTEKTEKPPKKISKKARKLGGSRTTICKLCGQTGHTKKTCEKNPDRKKQNLGTPKGEERCTECHTTGSRHFKTCSKWIDLKLPKTKELAPVDFDAPYVPPEEPTMIPLREKKALSEEDYNALKIAMQDKEFMSGRYALSHELSPREVNKAVMAESYTAYIEDMS